MSISPGKGFSKVRKAREALKDRADEILNGFLDTIIEARKAGKYEEALRAQQWLLEHIPADDEGQRLIEAGIDKQQKQLEGPKGPTVNIVGIQLGGKADARSLPEPYIDIDADSFNTEN